MRNEHTILCLTLGTLLALVAGCSKTENSATPASNADKAATPERTQLSQSAPTEAQPTTNVTADAATTTKATVETAVKPAEAALNPPKVTPPATTDTTSPATNKPPGPDSQAAAGLAGLSQDQMVRGLQEALAIGLQQAVANLGRNDGFLTNLNVKIPVPEKLQTAEKAARAMGEGKLADDFIASMNHAAEQAVPAAASVFADALKQMTIDDAKAILNGPSDAATQYFQKATQTNLYAKFYPIVQKATAQTGVTAAYKNLMAKADVTKSLGGLGSALGGSLLDKDTMDLDAYVTNKGMEGLFKMVAEQEKQIRQNPIARTTDTLQKVFGALTK